MIKVRLTCLIIGAIAIFPNHSFGETIYVKDFYFEIPTGWVEIPSSVINQGSQEAGVNAKFDFGYQRDPVGATPIYPYLLGFRFDIPPGKSIDDYARALSGMTPEKIAIAASTDEANSMLKTIEVQKVVVDSARQVFFLDSTIVNQQGFKIMTRSAFIKSNSEMLVLNYSDLEAELERNSSTRDELFESVSCRSTVNSDSAVMQLKRLFEDGELTSSRSNGSSQSVWEGLAYQAGRALPYFLLAAIPYVIIRRLVKILRNKRQ